MGGSCGHVGKDETATGPLVLEWDDPSTGNALRREYPGPAVLIGHNPKSHIVLNHPNVGRRHACLLRIEGRLYAVDLESRSGLRWEGVRRSCGWVDAGRSLRVGPIELRVIAGVATAPQEVGGATLAPTLPGFASRTPGPEVYLDIRHPGAKTRRCPMDRGVALVGSAALCQVRLRQPKASRFVCALVRTEAGVWAIDLLSTAGLIVNGARCREALLEDDDLIEIGPETVRVLYGDALGTVQPSRSLGVAIAAKSLAGAVGAPVAPGLATASSPVGDFASEAVLLPLLERALSQQRLGATEPALGEALLLMVQLLADVHGDHLALVRNELAEARRLGREVDSLQSTLNVHAPHSTPAEVAPAPRLDPMTARQAAEDRLSAWDQARAHDGRWRRALQRLVQR